MFLRIGVTDIVLTTDLEDIYKKIAYLLTQ